MNMGYAGMRTEGINDRMGWCDMAWPGALIPEALRTLFKEKATVLYPFERIERAEGYRGKWSLDLDACIGCGTCQRVCPSFAIEMVETDKTKTGKKPVMRLDHCCFCAQCAESCPVDAITLTKEYELAAPEKEKLLVE